ncbi:MAG: DUF2894 domain-containing protein [Myxococcales bacterium]
MRRRLDELRQAGAERWDAPALQLVENLIGRAERHHDAQVGERLLQRALSHTDELQRAFQQERQRAAEALDRLRAAEADDAGRIDAAIRRGELTGALRIARRRPGREPRLRDRLRRQLQAQLDAAAEARGITSPGLLDAPDPDAASTTAPGLTLAESLYRDAAAGAQARLTVARTTAAVPEEAGRYHPIHVGARALQSIDEHPAYLKAVLLRLQTLTTLWQHGAAPPASSGKAAHRAGKSGKKAGKKAGKQPTGAEKPRA